MTVEIPDYLLETIWHSLRSSLYDCDNQIKATRNPVTRELFRQRAELLFDAEKIFYDCQLIQTKARLSLKKEES